MAVFCFDIETCGIESTSVLLSLGMVYYDGEKSLTYENLIEDSIFIKFDSLEQRSMGRTVDKSTLDWWKKQSPLAQKTNLLPSKNDMSAKEGIDILRKWFTSKEDHKGAHIWVRGTLDQVVFESLIRTLGDEPFVPYNNYRDIRTAIDCFYPNSKNGYVDVDPNKCIGFDRDKVLKHHPIHDCAYDLCMLFGGVSD